MRSESEGSETAEEDEDEAGDDYEEEEEEEESKEEEEEEVVVVGDAQMLPSRAVHEVSMKAYIAVTDEPLQSHRVTLGAECTTMSTARLSILRQLAPLLGDLDTAALTIYFLPTLQSSPLLLDTQQTDVGPLLSAKALKVTAPSRCSRPRGIQGGDSGAVIL